MICGASITNRRGVHLTCILEDGHQGGCCPELPHRLPVSPPVLRSMACARESEFVQHLLYVVESAGDSLTFAEALNICRALCRARLGVPELRT